MNNIILGNYEYELIENKKDAFDIEIVNNL